MHVALTTARRGRPAHKSADFPHETTGKQFFNEEQFEVYRALGFHMADGVFSGKDRVEVLEGVDRPALFGGQIKG
jgi:hypothetical protein